MTINDKFKPPFRAAFPNEISPAEFQQLLLDGRIVDGRCGGVLLGKVADEGGPRGVFKMGSSYLVQGRFSGGDFVLNAEAACKNLNRLRAMNAGTTLREKTVEDPNDGIQSLICTYSVPHDRLVWLDFAQFVVTGEAAQKHVIELSRMNTTINPFFRCDLYEIFGCDPGTEDGCV